MAAWSSAKAFLLLAGASRTDAVPHSCLCSVDEYSNGRYTGFMGCGAFGYDRKWCYVEGPDCEDCASCDDPSDCPSLEQEVTDREAGNFSRCVQQYTVHAVDNTKWRYCKGYRCQPLVSIPALESMQLSAEDLDGYAGDWSECCAECSRKKTCAAWRYDFLSSFDSQCKLFLSSDGEAAESLRQDLLGSAVHFSTAVNPFKDRMYGLPGYDDVPQRCFGVRQQGQCSSYFVALYVLAAVFLIFFGIESIKPAYKSFRLGRAMRSRGEVVQCVASPRSVTHSWSISTRKGSMFYNYEPIYEVAISWEYPQGTSREMVINSGNGPKILGDIEVGGQTIKDFYLDHCTFAPKVPAEFQRVIEHVLRPKDVYVTGLVDKTMPDLVQLIYHPSVEAMVPSWKRPTLCGVAAATVLVFLLSLKLIDPLYDDPLLASVMRGLASKPPYRSELDTIRWCWVCGLALVAFFLSICAVPWWYFYATRAIQALLQDEPDLQPEAQDGSSQRYNRLKESADCS
eukprot:gnl/TRDRNA2_/TRDRNA2_186185_c0_seq1.p1 gnl/TRDRNA2_/TRDRNA2_186185_c0~~gnl/TRDRNA2_/TRDRNA2_186185_c0_seq1.p1  ORF type:complete len:511 (-),score=54.97 gnl/TRDRNA2_/TRDRNA2_186185_c0_seq1:83-1615(-)